MKHIFLFCHVRWYNAVAGYTLQAADMLAADGCRITVCVRRHSPLHKKIAGTSSYNCLTVPGEAFKPADILGLLAAPFRIGFYLWKNRPDVCMVMTANGAFLFMLLRFLLSGIRVIRFRGEAAPARVNGLNRLLYSSKGADAIIFASEYSKQLCKSVLPVNVPSCVIEYSFRKFYVFPPVGTDAVNREQVRSKMGIPLPSTVFCLLGRNQPVKGHMDILEAFVQADMPDAVMLFVIKDPDEFPDQMQKINTFIRDSGLEKRVITTGFTENLSEIMNCVDCGVVSSLWSEAICRVATEFFAFSLPVIAYPTGALPEVIQHGQNGFVCASKTPRALAKSMAQFYTMSPEERAVLSGIAGETYKQKYDGRHFLKTLYPLL